MVLFFLLISLRDKLDLVWRLALGFGLIPAIITFYPRLRMHETNAFVAEQTRNKPINWRIIFVCYWKKLLGTCSTWFLLDAVLYANGYINSHVFLQVQEFSFSISLFTGMLLEAAGLSDADGDDLLINNAQLVMILACIGLPGYWLSIFLIDR